MSLTIVDIYLESVAGMLLPLHSCWNNGTHILDIEKTLASAFDNSVCAGMPSDAESWTEIQTKD